MTIQDISDSEREQIEQELRDAVNAVIVGCGLLDMELAFKIFLNSPDFLMIGVDGSLCDYRTYVDNNGDYLATCSSFELITLREDIKLLSRDLAVFMWVYKAEAALKTGGYDVWEKVGATFVFSKIDGEWKVVRYHESTLFPQE
jgi:hypothetical protein